MNKIKKYNIKNSVKNYLQMQRNVYEVCGLCKELFTTYEIYLN